MRKFFIAFSCFVATAAAANAQNVILGRKSPTGPILTTYDERIQFDKAYPGYIVTTANDTLRGELLVPNADPGGKQAPSGAMVLTYAQRGVHFTSTDNPKASGQYLPNQLKSMEMEGIVFEAGMVSESGLNNDRQVFLLPRVADGKIKLFLIYIPYTHTNHDTGARSAHYEPNFCVKAGDGPVENAASVKFINFRKAMGKYVADCPVVAQKVEAKTYRWDDLEAIVREYNSCSGIAASK